MHGSGDTAEIDRLREAIAEASATRVHFIPADLSNAFAAEMLVKQSIAICERIDVLVNNVSAEHVSSTAAHTIVTAALADMQTRSWGRIINLATGHEWVGVTQTIAQENLHTNITCNAICLGAATAPLLAPSALEQAAERALFLASEAGGSTTGCVYDLVL